MEITYTQEELVAYIEKIKADRKPAYRQVFSALYALSPQNQNAIVQLLIDGVVSIDELVELEFINNDSVGAIVANANSLTENDIRTRNKVNALLKDSSSTNGLNDFRKRYLGGDDITVYHRTSPLDRALSILKNSKSYFETNDSKNLGLANTSPIPYSGMGLIDFDPSGTTNRFTNANEFQSNYIQSVLNSPLSISDTNSFEINFGKMSIKDLTELGVARTQHAPNSITGLFKILDSRFDFEAQLRFLSKLLLDLDYPTDMKIEISSASSDPGDVQIDISYNTWKTEIEDDHFVVIDWGDGKSQILKAKDVANVVDGVTTISATHEYVRIEPKQITVNLSNNRTNFISSVYTVRLNTSTSVNDIYNKFSKPQDIENLQKQILRRMSELEDIKGSISSRRLKLEIQVTPTSFVFKNFIYAFDNGGTPTFKAIVVYTDVSDVKRVEFLNVKVPESGIVTINSQHEIKNDTVTMYPRVYEPSRNSLMDIRKKITINGHSSRSETFNRSEPEYMRDIGYFSNIDDVGFVANTIKRKIYEDYNQYYQSRISKSTHRVLSAGMPSVISGVLNWENVSTYQLISDTYTPNDALYISEIKNFVNRCTTVLNDDSLDVLDLFPNGIQDIESLIVSYVIELCEIGDWVELDIFIECLHNITKALMRSISILVENGRNFLESDHDRYINPVLAAHSLTRFLSAMSSDSKLRLVEMTSAFSSNTQLQNVSEYAEFKEWVNSFEKIKSPLQGTVWSAILKLNTPPWLNDHKLTSAMASSTLNYIETIPWMIYTPERSEWLDFYIDSDLNRWMSEGSWYVFDKHVKQLITQEITMLATGYSAQEICESIVDMSEDTSWNVGERLLSVKMQSVADSETEFSLKYLAQYIDSEGAGTDIKLREATCVAETNGVKVKKSFNSLGIVSYAASDFSDSGKIGSVDLNIRLIDVYGQVHQLRVTRAIVSKANEGNVLKIRSVSAYQYEELNRVSQWNRFFTYGLMISLNSTQIDAAFENAKAPNAATLRDDTSANQLLRYTVSDSRMECIMDAIHQVFGWLRSNLPIIYYKEVNNESNVETKAIR